MGRRQARGGTSGRGSTTGTADTADTSDHPPLDSAASSSPSGLPVPAAAAAAASSPRSSSEVSSIPKAEAAPTRTSTSRGHRDSDLHQDQVTPTITHTPPPASTGTCPQAATSSYPGTAAGSKSSSSSSSSPTRSRATRPTPSASESGPPRYQTTHTVARLLHSPSPPPTPPESGSRFELQHVHVSRPTSQAAIVPDLDSEAESTPWAVAAAAAMAPPYGSVSMDPSRTVSPTGSDARANGSHALGQVLDAPAAEEGQNRSPVSRRSISKQTSRRSEELDGAMLVSGLEGRFGVTEAPLSGEIVDSDKQQDDSSEDVPLLYDDSSSGFTSDQEEDNSPDIVRASVPPTDDVTLSINTPRMWCLSVLFSILGSSTNLFFSLRYPSVAITPVIALLLVHPLGLFWDYSLKRPFDPGEEFVDGIRTPSISESPDHLRQPGKLVSWRRWLAQGRWNEKEHTCVYVSSNVAFGFAFATDIIVEQTHFYNQEAPILYQLLLTISTQILGYGFAGMARRFLVRPSGMIWPGTLMSAAMFGTLHKQENKPANGWRISRWKFFYIVWVAAFFFYFLPGLLMPALSFFNVLTWLAPKNVVVANLFGVSSGLGLFPLTFDWAQITYIGSPLLVPFWAAVNVVGGLTVVMWLVAPILYYANFLYSSYMPILSTAVFDNTGQVYNVSRILTDEFVFDRPAYENYSRVFLPVTYMLSYGVQFVGLAALLTHTACWHGKDIWRTWKKALAEAREDGKATYQSVPDSQSSAADVDGNSTAGRSRSRSDSNVEGGLLSREDIHCRLMRRYPDAPVTWYLLTFLSMAAIGIFVVEYYPVHLPWYGLLLALGIGALFFIPNGIIMAVTNQHSSIYLICQLICGALFPGRPIANMLFVSYGYISSAQGIKFASDLKLGHYMKVPPRIMFSVQIVATLVSSITQIGVLNWMFANVDGLCTEKAISGFTCPIARVHFNGSILWGVVGVNEFFGPQALYRALVWCFPLGAVLPIPLWLYARRRKASILRKVNLPVICGAMSWIPPATGLNFSVWAVVCYVFNYHLKRRAGAWWAKYTMTLSAALDSGLAFGIVVVFFGFLYPGWMKGFSWWGTEVYKQGCDWQACPYKTVDEGQTFGPDTW